MSENSRAPKLPEHVSGPSRNAEIYAIRPFGDTLNQLIDYVQYLEGRISTLESDNKELASAIREIRNRPTLYR